MKWLREWWRRPHCFRARRWLCRKFGHQWTPTLAAPWWTFGRLTVILACRCCGAERP